MKAVEFRALQIIDMLSGMEDGATKEDVKKLFGFTAWEAQSGLASGCNSGKLLKVVIGYGRFYYHKKFKAKAEQRAEEHQEASAERIRESQRKYRANQEKRAGLSKKKPETNLTKPVEVKSSVSKYCVSVFNHVHRPAPNVMPDIFHPIPERETWPMEGRDCAVIRVSREVFLNGM